jgi:PAS domain S-box-containing protein
MSAATKTYRQLTDEAVDLRIRLAEASDTLRAIQGGEVDAVLVQGPQGNQLFTLKGADDPYRVLIEEMNQGAVTLSADGSILYCNRRFADLLKTPLEEIVGLAFETFVEPSECARFAALLEAGRTGGSAGEITLCAGDTSSVPLQIALGPLPAESAAAICLIATDISESREKETRLHKTMADLVAAEHESRSAQQEARDARENAEQANRAKDNFLANLSHELRTPLTPVLMCVADLEQERAIAPEFRLQLTMMRRNVELEARLIDDLLDMTRVAHGKLQLVQSGPVDIHTLLMHTEQIVRSDALAKSVGFQFELKASEHHVGGDAARLHQVFWNLFKNAIKFTPEGGCITIHTANPAPGQIVLGVNDTGMGIDAKTLPFVFHAFEQGEARKLQHSGGLGLGLSIAKAIVELHGGIIRAESAGRGLGATFTIELATVLPFPTTQITEPMHASQPNSHRLRLLVIEDHEPTLEVLSRLLRRQGHDVRTACSVKSALLIAATHSFDLVISDIGLPDGNGIDLMQQLTKDYGLRGIALSGYGMAADHAKTKQAAFLAHLVKPIDFDQLHRVLQGIAPLASVNAISKMAG